MLHNNAEYRALLITNVHVPEKKRGYGRFRAFLSAIEKSGLVGIVCHVEVGNPRLTQRFERLGYFRDHRNYYVLLGTPLPV